MGTVTVHERSFEVYLPEETIQQRVKELAAQINSDYTGKKPQAI